MAMSMTSTSPPADTAVTKGGSAAAPAATRTMAPMPERRAGSSRVRRPPKHLRSPSPPPPPSNTAAALAAMQSPHPAGSSSSSSSHLATSANHKMSPSAAAAASANGAASSKKRQPSVALLDGNESTTHADSRRRSRPSGTSRPRQNAQHLAASQPNASAAPRTHSITKVRVRLPVKPLVEQPSTGYESDGGRVGPLPSSASATTAIKSEWAQEAEAEADADADVEGDFEAIAPPPLIFQRSARSSSRRTSGAIGAGGAGERKRPARTSFRHARTKSMPSIGAVLPAWQQRQGRSSLELADQQQQLLHHHSYSHPMDRDDGHISTAETSDGEDDFHRAMLDGDFDDDYAWSQAVAVSDDTPATTPRSPQSMCEPMSSGLADDREGGDASSVDKQAAKTAAAAAAAAQDIHDAVFSRALPSSSRRVQSSHVGSLTLSLPYDESTPVKKDNEDGASSAGDDARRRTIARFSTPTLRRTASRARLSQQEQQRSITRPSQANGFAALTGETTSPTTSPPMSPTRALMGLAAPLSSSATSKALTAAAEAAAAVSLSVTSSPFLAAVHHHASLSRPSSPLPTFQLPDAVAVAPAGVVTSSAISRHASPLSAAAATAAASPTSTHRDLTDVSPFPVASRSRRVGTGVSVGAGDLDDDELDLSASRSRHEASDEDDDLDGGDGSTPLTTYSSPGAGADDDDDEGNAPAVFGLPETMDMSAIDVAYGGTGEVQCEEEEADAEEQPAMVLPLRPMDVGEDAKEDVEAPTTLEVAEDRAQPRRGRTSVKRSIEEAVPDDEQREDACTTSKSARTTPEPVAAAPASSPPSSSKRRSRKTTPQQAPTRAARREATRGESPSTTASAAAARKSAQGASPPKTISTRTTRAGGGAATRPRRSR